LVDVKRIARGVLRTVVALLALAAGAVAVFLLYYEMHDFRPYFPRIQAIYSRLDPEDRIPPENVQNFVWKVNGETVDTLSSRGLLHELRGPMPKSGAWHYHSFMWYVTLRWHLSKEERLAFYCHYLPYEGGQGFTSAAKFYFDKQPDALSLDELAMIVAVGRAPGFNSPSRHPDHLEEAKKQLLAVYAKAQ
jgi:hypothetical protein